MTGRRLAALVAFDIVALLLVLGLATLAAWQVQRRAWKADLIARVEERVRAPPVPGPGRERWPGVTRETEEYRHVAVTGHWIDASPALVRAVTDLGGGYWVLAPFARDDGTTIVVNRGFVPASRRSEAVRAPDSAISVTITGLLRITEPGGAFLQSNDPASDRWLSRDVQAIAAARGWENAAPFFVDADRLSAGPGLPVGGLTVVAFSNNHAVYAVTWGILALMAAAGAAYLNLDMLRPSWIKPRGRAAIRSR